MTLILSCITKDYAIQVSDRLFTYIDPRTDLVVDKQDDKNKCVLLSDIMSFGYAGYGEIDNIRTDLWLTQILHSATECQSLSYIINLIKDNATNSLSKINISAKYKRHAFVGVGWTRYSLEESLSPILIVISNFHNEKWESLDEAIDHFNIIVSPRSIRPGEYYFSVIGQQPETNDEKRLFYYINRLLKRCSKKNVSAKILMGLLVITIRKLVAMREESGSYNTIGKNLLGVCLPKFSVMRDHLPGIPNSKIFIASSPGESVGTFLYFPEGQNDGIQYGPIIVSPGGAIFRNVKIGPSIKGASQKHIQIWDACDAVVLTEIIGAGSWTDKRRPEIADDYSLGYSAYGMVPSWPSGEPCPYYGSLYGINTDNHVISKIEQDTKYIIIIKNKSLIHEIPNNNWLKKLSFWFTERGIAEEDLKSLISTIDGLERMEILEKLSEFLKIPKS